MANDPETVPDPRPGDRIRPDQMRIGDTVRMDLEGDPHAPFSSCIVLNIANGQVFLFRPYAITSDFVTTSGIIPYIGIERYSVELTSSVPYILLHRNDRIH